jgi:transposase
MDEVHFQQHGTRCKMWIDPEEKSPVVLQEPTRRGIGYFGAVRIRDGKFIFQCEENMFNAETSLRFLKKIRRASCRSGRPVAVIIDNARYHHATLHKGWRESAAKSFALFYLPPYSPELNPIERVWKLVRRRKLHNQYFASIDDMKSEAESLFRSWRYGSEDLMRLCKINKKSAIT